jgi:hypothetical protein
MSLSPLPGQRELFALVPDRRAAKLVPRVKAKRKRTRRRAADRDAIAAFDGSFIAPSQGIAPESGLNREHAEIYTPGRAGDGARRPEATSPPGRGRGGG